MICPRCRGTTFHDLGGGQYSCAGQILVDAVPPGMGGNAGPAPIPLYGPCGHTFTRSEGERALPQLQPLAAQSHQTTEARFDRHRLHEDPSTPAEIARLAKELITTRPGGTVPVVVRVEIPGLRRRHGFAEVYRAWPVGEYKYYWKDATFEFDMAIASDGRPLRLNGPGVSTREMPKPSVRLTPAMRWSDPVQEPKDHFWRASVLQALSTALAAPSSAEDSSVPAVDLEGVPLTAAAGRKLAQITQQKFQAGYRYRTLRDLYGTPAQPARHGSPDSSTRKAWRQMEALQNRFNRFERREAAIRGVAHEPTDLGAQPR